MKILINGYTVTESMHLKRFSTYEDIKKLDKIIGHLKRNRKKYTEVVVILAYIFFFNPNLSFATDKVLEMGYGMIKKIQLYAGIIAMVMAVIEIAGELIKGGRNHFQIIFKYGAGYIALLLVPTIFETIRNLF